MSGTDLPKVVYEGPTEFVATDLEPRPMRLRVLCPRGLPEDAQLRLVIRNFGAFLRNAWSLDEITASGEGRIHILHGLPQTFADLLAGGELPGGGGLIGGEQNHIYLCTVVVTERLGKGAELCFDLQGTMRSTAWLNGSLQVRLCLPGETEYVRIGDPITLQLGFQAMRNNLANAPGMDNRTGLWVVMEALRRCRGRQLNCALYSVSTVQEEVGLRGARTSAYGIDPRRGSY